MRQTRSPVITLTDNPAAFDNHRPDHWVRRSVSFTLLRQVKRHTHVFFVCLSVHKKTPFLRGVQTGYDYTNSLPNSSPIRTIPSGPEFHRLCQPPVGSRPVTAGRGFAPRPEEFASIYIANKKTQAVYRLRFSHYRYKSCGPYYLLPVIENRHDFLGRFVHHRNQPARSLGIERLFPLEQFERPPDSAGRRF